MKKWIFVLVALCAGCAQHATKPVVAPAIDAAASARLAAQVREEVHHAWRGYTRYAWGHDDLAPLSKGAHDWYAAPLLMTPVDALDTLVLLGLNDEANEARELIATKLDFDRDIYGATVRLGFVQRLRDERAFETLDALKTQIAADGRAAQVLFGRLSL